MARIIKPLILVVLFALSVVGCSLNDNADSINEPKSPSQSTIEYENVLMLEAWQEAYVVFLREFPAPVGNDIYCLYTGVKTLAFRRCL
jgi:hypothetical protein